MVRNSYQALRDRMRQEEKDRATLPGPLYNFRHKLRSALQARNMWAPGRSRQGTNKQIVLFRAKIGEIVRDTKIFPQDHRGMADAVAFMAFAVPVGMLTAKELLLLNEWLVEAWDPEAEEREWVYRRQARDDILAMSQEATFRQLADLFDKAHSEYYDQVSPQEMAWAKDLLAQWSGGLPENAIDEERGIANAMMRDLSPLIVKLLGAGAMAGAGG